MTRSINGTQHNSTVIMLSVVFCSLLCRVLWCLLGLFVSDELKKFYTTDYRPPPSCPRTWRRTGLEAPTASSTWRLSSEIRGKEKLNSKLFGLYFKLNQTWFKLLRSLFETFYEKTLVARFKSNLLLNIQMYNMSSLHKYY